MAAQRFESVRDELEERMRSGAIKPGARFPAERRLCEELGVSRATLRAALDLLEADGLVDRRHGSGTYACEPRITIDVSVLISFTEGVLGKGRRPAAQLIDCDRVPARLARFGAVVATALGVEPDAPVWQIVRLRTANGVPIALERSWFAVERTPDLQAHDLEGRSIYALLAEEYGLRPDHASQQLDAVPAEPEDADDLGCDVGAPLMRVTRTARTLAGEPVEYARDLYLPHRSTFVAHARIPERAATSPAPQNPTEEETS
ncbi:GntR family transcriptional regulator [Patulibacter sp. SYSU D01012]|uniref:GntR family transcriptional regulator n=1 Tax=Patulibacter sp. SYSU D01012 TaxID=2817381 RepID=UPI001B316823|nr:GntR family transcriptional regulator [Patulibacter sp. SYSU D01012]